MSDASGFVGFPDTAWTFLTGLSANNTRSYFTTHRANYQAGIAEPSAALVRALSPLLAEGVHPNLQAEAKVGRSLFRINRDTRFSADKTPYKTHVDFLFWADGASREDDPRTCAACIMRITSHDVLTGAGRIGLRGPALEHYRALVTDPTTGPQLRGLIDTLLATGCELSEPSRTRPPRPHPADHPNADLLVRDGFHVTRTEPHPATIATVGFVDWVIERLHPYRRVVDALR